MDERDRQLKKERALLASIRQGNAAAWGDLYDLYAPLLYRRILMPRLANPTAAEDALSETFRTAIERIDRYEEQPAGIYPWLARIAHNKAMDMHRARAVTGRKLNDLGNILAPLMQSVPGADEVMALECEQQVLRRRTSTCLDRLNPRYKKVLQMRFLREMSREQCAEAMDIKVATFDVVLLRAVRALRKAWSEEDTDG